MAQKLSRRKLSAYVAEAITSGAMQAGLIRQLAAYLVQTGRTREAQMIVRDVEQALADKGIVVADVASARPLSAQAQADITMMIGTKTVHLRQSVDPSLLGGVSIATPGKQYDGTIRHKLATLKAKQL